MPHIQAGAVDRTALHSSSTTLDLTDLVADASSQTLVVSLYGDAFVAEVARAIGPYKLSHHSGSDKFSIYPTFAAATRGMLHLKTAGTSAELYARTLEAHFCVNSSRSSPAALPERRPITETEGLARLFGLTGRTAVVVGGSGVLGSALAQGLAGAGARVALVGRRIEACERVATVIRQDAGEALAVAADVLDRASLERAAAEVHARFGPVDILVNAAGGNRPEATTSADTPFFALDLAAAQEVFASNFTGLFQCCQVFGRAMAANGSGCIVNIASMSGLRPLTRVPAYSAAKAAVINFTQWLAVHMAQEYGPQIRVNAIAPGFFLTEQNRYLLVEEQSGGWTARGAAIVAQTPMGRLGSPDELVGTLLWLAGPAATFVTGVVVPVDGGFAAFGGV
jgi:NAD(P)-dependent dehydrogenase (short-subunit alcohol dehydrogenase family)